MLKTCPQKFVKSLIFIVFIFPALSFAEFKLYMAEFDHCPFCAKWNRDVGHIYPKTLEGKAAPLKRYDLATTALKLTLRKPVAVTPTFILAVKQQEIGRIEGYNNDEQFWAALSVLFDRANIDLTTVEINE